MIRLRVRVCIAAVLLAAGLVANAAEHDRIVVFGDVHGGFTELTNLLTALEIIDADGNWIGGRTHLVSLGDLLDRGPDSRRVMDLLMRLEKQAPDSGGLFSLILGNHEIMNMTGDLRYVAPEEYAAFAADEDAAERASELAAFVAANPDLEEPERRFAEQYPPGFFAHRHAFQPDGEYGRWLLSKPQILVTDGTAFVHGGLSAHFASESIEDYNHRASAEIIQLLEVGAQLIQDGVLPRWGDLVSAEPVMPDAVLPDALVSLRQSINFGPIGPTWYRGTANCHALIEETRFEQVLRARGLDRIIMGHTPTSTRTIQSRFDGRAILADTGMLERYYKGRPSAVILDGGTLTALTLMPDPQLEPHLDATPQDLRTSDEAELLRGLAAAAKATSGVRADEPFQVDVAGRSYKAVFRRGGRREQAYRLAAYTLDKHLGLGLVAPIMPFTVANRSGTLEAWPARGVTEQERAERTLPRPNWCGALSDYQLMYAFDALIGNEGRTAASIHYGLASWLMYLTGHERAFSSSRDLPPYLNTAQVALPVGLKNKLARLEPAGLEDLLGEYLNSTQIGALVERRDVMLESWPVEE